MVNKQKTLNGPKLLFIQIVNLIRQQRSGRDGLQGKSSPWHPYILLNCTSSSVWKGSLTAQMGKRKINKQTKNPSPAKQHLQSPLTPQMLWEFSFNSISSCLQHLGWATEHGVWMLHSKKDFKKIQIYQLRLIRIKTSMLTLILPYR